MSNEFPSPLMVNEYEKISVLYDMEKNYCDSLFSINFSGIFSWIDKNIENACEKTMSCMYVCMYV